MSAMFPWWGWLFLGAMVGQATLLLVMHPRSVCQRCGHKIPRPLCQRCRLIEKRDRAQTCMHGTRSPYAD